MKLFLIIAFGAKIVGVTGPLKACPAIPQHTNKYEIACEYHAKRPEIGAYRL